MPEKKDTYASRRRKERIKNMTDEFPGASRQELLSIKDVRERVAKHQKIYDDYLKTYPARALGDTRYKRRLERILAGERDREERVFKGIHDRRLAKEKKKKK